MQTEQLSTVQVAIPERAYPVYIGNHLFGNTKPLNQHLRGKQIAIVSDENVAPLFEPPLLQSLKDYQPLSIILPAGEEHKNLGSAEIIYRQLLEHGFNRDATMIAVGGGVVGDLCGFVAATYQRGVSFIQMPTSLLAQVDASIGGKTAVNHPLGKNMIGAFHQPKCVIVDIAALASLPDREYRSGIAEVIKYGLIMDKGFFEYLEEHMGALRERDSSTLRYAVETACTCKARIVAADEVEHGQRALLNLGHTFGHAIETAQQYKQLLHGEAVAIGMRLAAQLSHQLGYIDKQALERVINLVDAAGLPFNLPDNVSPQQLITLMSKDKKVAKGTLRLVLLKALGKAVLEDAPKATMLEDLLKTATTAKF